MVEVKKPTQAQAVAFRDLRVNLGKLTKEVRGLSLLLATANTMQREIDRIGPFTQPEGGFIPHNARRTIIQLREVVPKMNTAVEKVLDRTYGLQFVDGEMNIVSPVDDESARRDVILSENFNFGLAVTTTIVIVSGLTALTVWAVSDDSVERSRSAARKSAFEMQMAMVNADLAMMRESAEKRQQWEAWKKKTGTILKEATKDIPKEPGFMDKFKQGAGTVGGIALAAGLGLLAYKFASKKAGE